MSRKNNKRITWNESHVYKILQYVQQIYRPDKEPYILVSELHGLLRGDSSLAAYSKNQLKMKLYQIKQAIDRYSNGSTGAGLITRRVYFDLALAIYGKKPRKSASCEERIEGEQTQLQSSDHHQFEQIKRFITVVENRFQFPKIGCCRLCRSTYTTGGVDLFQDTYDNQSYNQLLQNMLFITIDEKIDASRKICARCAKFLENVAAFVQQCHISNGILSISESSEAFSSIASADNPGLTGKNDLSGNKHYFPEYTDSKCEKNENAELSAIEQIDIDYLELKEFRQIIDQFASIVEIFSVEVDQVKMRAIGVQNLLKTFSKQRESERQAIQSEIIEKMVELDKLKIEYQYLQRVESEQQEIIDDYYQNQ
ncbi:uncharacterized protein LOC129723389 isoform X2 [Wyeomyia smithii]|uniref:uncharacterized protein LOC129723389 isoform X2 n=1 Tax=Wyeomyia smithii TaxID=174621 RepID=UPI002467DAD6|nr:uncharacterized protein LOC129723389 isoform X2 [Wyeomyia smithii]